jgi:hypothetical protein
VAHESSGSRRQIVGAVEANLRVHHSAAGVDPQDAGKAGGTVSLVDALAIEQESMLQIVGFGIASNFVPGFIPGVHPQNDQSVLAVGLGQFTQVWSLHTTRTSPKGEEGQNHGFAAKIGQADGSSIEVL